MGNCQHPSVNSIVKVQPIPVGEVEYSLDSDEEESVVEPIVRKRGDFNSRLN